MAEVKDFGTIFDVPPEPEGEAPSTISVKRSKADIIRFIKQLTRDTAKFKNFEWVDVPDDLPLEAREAWQELYFQVEDYRSWVSVEWWARVDENPAIPPATDESFEAVQRRMDYFAYVAFEDTKRTRWLPFVRQNTREKVIECKIEEFHSELIDAVVGGFTNVTDAVRKALETVLESLGKTIESTTLDTYRELVTIDDYRWNAPLKLVAAFLLLIWFSVDHKLVEFQKGKKKVTHVKVTIRYLEWEARFNQREWLKHWAEVNSHEEYALAKAFVHNNTTRVRF